MWRPISSLPSPLCPLGWRLEGGWILSQTYPDSCCILVLVGVCVPFFVFSSPSILVGIQTCVSIPKSFGIGYINQPVLDRRIGRLSSDWATYHVLLVHPERRFWMIGDVGLLLLVTTYKLTILAVGAQSDADGKLLTERLPVFPHLILSCSMCVLSRTQMNDMWAIQLNCWCSWMSHDTFEELKFRCCSHINSTTSTEFAVLHQFNLIFNGFYLCLGPPWVSLQQLLHWWARC